MGDAEAGTGSLVRDTGARTGWSVLGRAGERRMLGRLGMGEGIDPDGHSTTAARAPGGDALGEGTSSAMAVTMGGGTNE